MSKQYDVAAYVWPAYTGDEPRAHIFWPGKYGEWQSVKSAEAKFEGHSWPRKPLWGYVNEADPTVMEMEIEQAVSHGVNVFIYDWYWYDKRPFLQQCLDNGFLGAKNNGKMKFYISWCNHNGTTFWDKRLSDDLPTIIWSGQVDRREFERVVDYVIERYFHKENYYRVNGCPVFSLHYLKNLIPGLGGVKETAEAFEYFRQKTREAGFPDLHLQLNLVGQTGNFMGFNLAEYIHLDEVLRTIRFDSCTHYQFLAFTDMNRDYLEVIPDAVKEWEAEAAYMPFPYCPHVSVGWDNNPRTHKLMPTICKNNTPENFEKALREAKAFVDRHDLNPPLVTVNSWNEWTETSYLQPDDLYGYGYLDAVKRVFGRETQEESKE